MWRQIREFSSHAIRQGQYIKNRKRLLLRQNQSVQLRLICIYVCPTSAHRGFRYGYRRYKGNTFTLKTALFGWQSMILRSDLTLLNINVSKNSTFAWFVSQKVCIINDYSYFCSTRTRQSLSTMLKCAGRFCFYGYMATRIPFIKTYSTPQELVQLLKTRGMEITDEEKAQHYLSHIGYYRVSAYMYPLLSIPKEQHLFKQGVTFSKVMMLYRTETHRND